MQTYTNEELVNLIQNNTMEDQKNYLAILYKQNYGMIHKICKQYSAYECIEDLEQEAFFGLLMAIERYNSNKGSFFGYAQIWIKQTVRRYLDECGSVLRLPVYLRDQIFRYDQMLKNHKRKSGKFPSDAEIMKELSIDRRRLQEIKKYSPSLRTTSLDKISNTEDGSCTLYEMLADPKDYVQEIDDRVDYDIMKADVWKEVDALGEESSLVIRQRYQNEQTLKDIGETIGISTSRVRDIQYKALRKLRHSETIKR